MTPFLRAFCAAAAFALTLLSSSGATADTLYDRLGGQPAIECWIDLSLPVIFADSRINDYFAGPLNEDQPQNLRDSLVEFGCFVTGGPCAYTGRNMSCAHTGLGVGHDAFTAFLEDLERGARLCRLGNTGYMPDPAYSELNKLLLSLRPTVVQDDPGEGGCP